MQNHRIYRPQEFIKYSLHRPKKWRSVKNKQLCIIDPKGGSHVPTRKDIPDISINTTFYEVSHVQMGVHIYVEKGQVTKNPRNLSRLRAMTFFSKNTGMLHSPIPFPATKQALAMQEPQSQACIGALPEESISPAAPRSTTGYKKVPLFGVAETGTRTDRH
jgi:hypothetical protein